MTNVNEDDLPGSLDISRPWYRPRLKPLFLRLHRWTALASLVLVAAFFLSGAVVMFSDDAIRVQQSSAYHGTESDDPASFSDALAAANEATPDYTTWALSRTGNVYVAFQLDPDYNSVYTFVDRGTGTVNQTLTEKELDSVAWPWFRQLAWNIHVCALSCEGMPWHVSFMAGKVPVVGWQWKTTALMATALATIFLALSGLVAWWPSFRK